MDNYSHGFSNIIYIEQNILGPAECSDEYDKLVREYNSQLQHNCDCTSECKENCKCLNISGGVSYLNKEGDENDVMLTFNRNKSVTYPIYECTDLCACSRTCGNRLVQFGPLPSLIVKPAQIKSMGLGLFTEKFITAGTFICEYAGEIITKTQALYRQKLNKIQGNMNYIFCLNEFVDGRANTNFIDPSHFGNIGRYINHSCDPNSEIMPVRVDCPIPKLAIFSCIDISPGEEITFNYGLNSMSITDETTERVPCLCQSAKCKGFIPLDSY